MTYQQENIKPYDAERSKTEQVEEMFNNIAPTYDLLNHSLSWGIDKRWRKSALRALKPFEPQKILDVATGTGDFAILAARMLLPESLLGIDLSEGMMNVAREKVRREGLGEVIHFKKEDGLALSFPEASFDAVTVAYGVRNFSDLERGLSEMKRVLRSGGHLLIVELTSPRRFPMKQFFWLYSHVLMPLVGKLISRDMKAYKYLPATMEVFPQGEQMKSILEKVGFKEVHFRRFTFGLCTFYLATAP